MSLWSWFLVGAVSWVLAIVLKIAADVAFRRYATFDLPDWAAATLSGIWSSLCELGLAAIAFLVFGPTLSGTLMFAAGAATAEFFAILPAAFSARLSQTGSTPKDRAGWKAFFLERGLVFLNHLASRVLVWTGTAGMGGITAIACAFGVFAVGEGTQAYAQARQWNWLEPRTQRLFFGFFTALIITQSILAALWY